MPRQGFGTRWSDLRDHISTAQAEAQVRSRCDNSEWSLPLTQSAFASIISPSATLVKSFTIRALARPKCVPKYSVCMCACVGRGGEYTRLCHKCYQKLGQTEEVFTLIIVPCSHRARLFLWVTRSELRGGAFRHVDETPCLSETMRRSSHTETVMLRSETREACLKA